LTEQVIALFEEGGTGYRLIVLGLLVLSAGIASRVAAWMWARLIARLRSRSFTWAKEVADATVSRVGLLAFLVFLQPALDQLALIGDLGATSYHALAGDALYILTVLALALLAEALIRGTLDWYLAEVAHRTQTTLDDEFLPLLKKLNIVVVLTLAVTVILGHFGVELGGLLATAGIASLAVALAAQETLSNVFAGLSLLLDKPFREGDRIELADGRLGDVTEVGLRTTKILTRQNTVLVIPNKQLADDQIINHVYPDVRYRLITQIGVAYSTDLRVAKQIILDILSEQEGVLKDPPPSVDFVEFGDSALVLRIVFWLESYRDRFRALDKFNMAANDWFRQEGIEIPYPIRTVHLAPTETEQSGDR